MTHEAKIHPIQTSILRELLFVPSARFTDLQKSVGLESDQVKFHIARLVELEYVQKTDQGYYVLSSNGKEYANKLDTDRNQIERQPKSAVILVVEWNGKLLVQERLKHPYFGFWGFPGGKIRWGETILQAAARELNEETGLSASLESRGVYHEITRSKETGEVLEDKIFQVIYGHDPSGELIETFDSGRNAWLSLDEVKLKDKYYKSFDIEYSVGMGEQSFVEQEQIYDQGEF
ncbi:MAG: NUDIX domain-containing protein [Candidatus Microsaccharimonas sp.]